MTYKAVIFDFFGVFAPDVYPLWLSKYVQDSGTREAYFLELAQGIDVGKTTKEQFLRVLAEESGFAPDEVEKQLNDFDLDEQMVGLLRELSGRYKTALLCNGSSRFVDMVLEKHDIRRYFTTIVISSEVGLSKPQPEIYKLVLDTLQVAPEETVFIDDRASNIQGAEKVGITAIHYQKGFKQLVESLSVLGIKERA